MWEFVENRGLVEDFLAKAKLVRKRKTLSEADIDPEPIKAHGTIARRHRDDKDFGVSNFPYEEDAGVGAFNGGYFEPREWPIRRHTEKHQPLLLFVQYKSKYVNAEGYWMEFHEAPLDLREEKIKS